MATDGPSMLQDLGSPLGVLSQAFRRAPGAGKIAYGALALFAAASIVVSWFADLWLAMGAAILIVVLGTIGILIGTALQGGRLRLLGDILAWAIAFLALTTAVLSLLVLITGWPSAASTQFARLLNSPSFLTARGLRPEPVVISTSGQISNLLGQFLTLDAPGDRFDRLRVLNSLPALELNGVTLSMSGPGEQRTLFASRLTLRDAILATNGGHLVIEVVELDARDNGRIQSFANGAKAPAGEPGHDGGDGKSGGTITLQIHGRLLGPLQVNLGGQEGGAGGAGGPGQPGLPGAQGSRASSSLFDCKRGPGAGGPGTAGSSGGPGGNGGNGGRGGSLVLVADDPTVIARNIKFDALGGKGGEGGPGGPGGQGGPGGAGGSSDGLCRGIGSTGSPGARGATGPQGKPGAQGEDSTGLRAVSFRSSAIQWGK